MEPALWYVGLLLLTIPGALLLLLVRPPFPDGGWMVGKFLGLVAVAVATWYLGLVGVPAGTARLVAAGVLVLAGVAALVLLVRGRRPPPGAWRWILAGEGVVLLGFLVVVLVRSFDPGANTTEKPMELLFLTSVFLSPSMPPPDPWFAGGTISYYYLGYLLYGLPGMLLGVAPEHGLVLGLATVAGLGAGLAFVTGAAIVERLRWAAAAVTVGLVFLVGNGVGLLEAGRAWRVLPDGLLAWAGVKDLGPALVASVAPGEFWWWWRATRLVDTVRGGRSLDYTINEFPLFSLLLGDLHPHVMGIPFLLLAVAFATWLLVRPPQGWRITVLLAGAGLAAGAGALVNIWDLPLLIALPVLAAWGPKRMTWTMTWPLTVGCILLPLLAIFPFVPFYAGFTSQAMGIGIWEGPGTRPLHTMLMWAVFLLPLTLWLWTRRPREVWWTALVWFPLALGLVTEAALLLGAGDVLQAVAARAVPALVIVALVLAAPRAFLGHPTDRVVWLLMLFGVGLLLVAEWFFVRDLFGTRMNTVFKAWYQAWILLGVAVPAAVVRLIDLRPAWGTDARAAAAVVAVVLLAGPVYYALAAGWDRTVALGTPQGTDSLAWMQRSLPGDLAAGRWLRERQGAVHAEAVGDSYSAFGRIALVSGNPTILGWPGHERQWRGPIPAIGTREADVQRLYQSPGLEAVRSILDQYGVRYVVVGPLERQKYGDAGLAKFRDLLVAYASGDVTIYEVP